MRRLVAISSAWFVLLILAGCGGYIGRAERAYHDGRYLEVAESLGDHEGEVGKLSPRGQAHYGLYLGLSLEQLGDRDGAERWLGFAGEIDARQPGALRPEERRKLDEARGRLTRAPGDEQAAVAKDVPLDDFTPAAGTSSSAPLRTVRDTPR